MFICHHEQCQGNRQAQRNQAIAGRGANVPGLMVVPTSVVFLAAALNALPHLPDTDAHKN
jgi:hypothetical protein